MLVDDDDYDGDGKGDGAGDIDTDEAAMTNVMCRALDDN